MKYKFMLLPALGLVLLAGCDKAKSIVGGDVAIVKNGTMEFDKSLSVGQAIDSYKYFKSTRWEAIKTDNGRRVVNVVGNLDTSRYPSLIDGPVKEADLRFQFIINQDKTFDLKWCGISAAMDDGTRKEPEDNANLVMCMNTLREIYNNEPKETSAEEVAAVRVATQNKKGCDELMTYMKNGKTQMESYFADHQKYPIDPSFLKTSLNLPPHIIFELVVEPGRDNRDPEEDFVFNGASNKCDKMYVTSSYDDNIDEVTQR